MNSLTQPGNGWHSYRKSPSIGKPSINGPYSKAKCLFTRGYRCHQTWLGNFPIADLSVRKLQFRDFSATFHCQMVDVIEDPEPTICLWDIYIYICVHTQCIYIYPLYIYISIIYISIIYIYIHYIYIYPLYIYPLYIYIYPIYIFIYISKYPMIIGYKFDPHCVILQQVVIDAWDRIVST